MVKGIMEERERERGRRSEEAVVPLQKIDREAIFFF